MRPRQLPRVLRVVGLDLAASLEQRRSAVLEVQTCFAAVAQRRSASEHCSCSARSHCGTHRLPALRAHWQMCRRPCGRLGHELHDGAASRGGRVVKTKLLRNRSPDLYATRSLLAHLTSRGAAHETGGQAMLNEAALTKRTYVHAHAARRALRGLENTTPSLFSPSKL